MEHLRHDRLVAVRRATAEDQAAIVALVRSEALNPWNLAWPNFVVAIDAFGIAGAVQMRRHRDGSSELASLVVAPRLRGHGIAGRLIDELLDTERARVHMITGSVFAYHYLRWGFVRVEAARAPSAIRWTWRIGTLACRLGQLRGRPLKKLCVLERPPRVAPVAR